jgi:ribosome biogenesis GTPase
MARDSFRTFSSGFDRNVPDRAPTALQRLGWDANFSGQIDAELLARAPPARVIAVHRSGFETRGDGFEFFMPPRPDVTVGDWLLVDRDRPASSRRLERKSVLARRAPGTGRAVQYVGANVDTVFVVTSCNQDFSVARLERYLALAFEAKIEPVILLTKTDLIADACAFAEAASAIDPRVGVVALDARGPEPAKKLAAWLKPGRTLAFLGSSGVGKSTLVNALCGASVAAVSAVRETDDTGRHATTHRRLRFLACGASVLDTPGLRELQLAGVETGLAEVFADLEDAARHCQFSDCRHETEPGCAVRAAIDAGQIDAARLERWRKLVREEAFNSASLAERRRKDREFGRVVRAVLRDKPRKR